LTLTETGSIVEVEDKLEEITMYYIIKFYKPTSADKLLEERFTSLSAVKRWQRLIQRNGYEVSNIIKKTKEKLNDKK
jgi:hypothetical protein